MREPGTDLIIQEKRNHGGPRDVYIQQAGRAPINLTTAWDLEPGPTTWAPDGRFIYFTAAIGGESALFRASVPAGVVEQVTKGERRIGTVRFDKAVSKMIYTVGLQDVPPEVYIANIDGTGERRLSDANTALSTQVEFSRSKRLRWASLDRTEIEGWLTFPHGYDASKGPYPLIVFSHGGPHAATGHSFDFKKQVFAANGYFVFDTNFRSSTGYGEAFKWATWGEWGRKDGEDIVSGIDFVLKHYPVDPNRVGHTGHSYGGFLTNWLITQYPDRFAAAVSGAGISNWISDYGTADIYRTKETEFYGTPWDPVARERMIRQSPISYAGRVKTPTLFVHGEVDQRVPVRRGRADVLRAQAPRRAGEDDPVRGPAAWHWRALEQRAPDDQRTPVVERVPEAGQVAAARSRLLPYGSFRGDGALWLAAGMTLPCRLRDTATSAAGRRGARRSGPGCPASSCWESSGRTAAGPPARRAARVAAHARGATARWRGHGAPARSRPSRLPGSVKQHRAEWGHRDVQRLTGSEGEPVRGVVAEQVDEDPQERVPEHESGRGGARRRVGPPHAQQERHRAAGSSAPS